MDQISIVCGLISLYLLKRCQLLTGTDFLCGGFITLSPLTLTSFKAMGETLKKTWFLKTGISPLYQERAILIVSKFQYTQYIGSRPVKLKPMSKGISSIWYTFFVYYNFIV